MREHFSLGYGFQSRFLANGFLDFSLGLYYLKPYVGWYPSGLPATTDFRVNNVVIASRSLIGLALGDWKRASHGPLCDVLHCDYLVRQHLKVRLPEVNIGLRNQSFRAEIGYERKIGASPFSASLNIRNGTERTKSSYNTTILLRRTELEAQFRWYYLQKSQVRRGKASDNLSGLYVSTNLGFRWDQERYNLREKYSGRTPVVGISLGYQQRLFHKLYFDSAFSFSGLEYFHNILKLRYTELNARAGIGFAF